MMAARVRLGRAKNERLALRWRAAPSARHHWPIPGRDTRTLPNSQSSVTPPLLQILAQCLLCIRAQWRTSTTRRRRSCVGSRVALQGGLLLYHPLPPLEPRRETGSVNSWDKSVTQTVFDSRTTAPPTAPRVCGQLRERGGHGRTSNDKSAHSSHIPWRFA